MNKKEMYAAGRFAMREPMYAAVSAAYIEKLSAAVAAGEQGTTEAYAAVASGYAAGLASHADRH